MTLFPLKMAWRETRAAWRHFLYFFVCIALGVSALVGVGLFAANVETAVTREARGLLGGDVEVRLSRLLSEKGQGVLQSLATRGITTIHVSELVAMAAVPVAGAGVALDLGQLPPTQIVELKAVDAGYPFYGDLQLEPDRPLAELLTLPESGCQSAPCYGALVQQALLIRMDLAVGDRVKIGQAVFTITGLIRKEPDRVATMFSLGPRVMISRSGLAATELIQPGSRVRERYLLRVPPTVSSEALPYELRGRLAGESARVTTYRTAQPQLKRFLDQLTRYLGLVGLIALFVGGIGVATTVRAFLREKLQTIAILKTLGADSGIVVRTYLFQTMFLGVIGSLAGAALGVGVQGALPPILAEMLSIDLLHQLKFSHTLTMASLLPILKGVALGILTTLLFTLWPLLGVRDIQPALMFQRAALSGDSGQGLAHPSRRADWRRWLGLADRLRFMTVMGIAVGLAGLAIWQAGSWKVGLIFIGALAAAVVLLLFAALAVVRVMKLVRGPRSLIIRQAISNLHRPGSQATPVMVALGIAVMVIVSVSLLERSLLRQVEESRPADAPTFFFIDIQPDQKDAFMSLIRARTTDPNAQATPIVRSRLHALNGQSIASILESDRETIGKRDRRKKWFFTRDYALTFLPQLPKGNAITKGTWWAPGELPGKPLVSVEEDAAKNLGLDLGSTIEFEIQGTTVSAEVSSIRKVDWGNMSTNFYMILSPGSLEGAPFTYVATVRIPAENEVPLQQAVVAAFPNVTAINIGEVLESFARILDRLALAIQAVAVFCILAGGIVMATALATTRYRRLYESVVFKALGATRDLIACSFAAEYALLGSAAGLIGVVLASALSWLVLTFILDLPWTLQPRILASGLALTVLLTLTVGFLSTFRILGQRPLAVLRQE